VEESHLVNNKSSGIFIRVTEDFNKSLDKILKHSVLVAELKAKGYDIDKSVLGRFGYLYLAKHLELLAKNPDILLAASKSDASKDLIISIEKDLQK